MYELMDLKLGLIILVSLGLAIADTNPIQRPEVTSLLAPLSPVDHLIRTKRDLDTAESVGAGAGVGGGGGAFKKVSESLYQK